MAIPITQKVRTALHQLLQREAAAVLQPPHVRAGAGGVRQGGHRVGDGGLWHGLRGHHPAHGEAHGSLGHP